MKKTLLLLTLSGLLTACGGGSSSNDFFPIPSTSKNQVTGTASAPAGTVASFQQKSVFQVALEFIIPGATAEITGLDIIPGADVELIRVDNTGTQIGDVLATTTTSATGKYTLTLPAGVKLAGNLVVRISGGGDAMHAQVVQRRVNISPVSEFVLQNFIDSGADLENLETRAVVKLSGQVEEFDVASTGANMADMLAQLEQEVGHFVDEQVDVIQSAAGDANQVAATYRNFAFSFGLHDDDGTNGVGTIGVDHWLTDLQFQAGNNGNLTVKVNGEDNSWTNHTYASGWMLEHHNEIDTSSESIPGTYSDNNTVTIQGPFEEEFESGNDYGFRFYPTVMRLQSLLNSDILVMQPETAAVRFSAVDTNNDQVTDAIDPNQKDGDEVFRALEIFVSKPDAATAADLTGDYGRIYLGHSANNSGQITLESEVSTLSFDGVDSLNASSADGIELTRSGAGVVSTAATTPVAESGISYGVTPDGKIQIERATIDSQLDSQFGFFVMLEQDTVDDQNTTDEFYQSVSRSLTLATKLPASMQDITTKQYRLFKLAMAFDGTAIELNNFRFDSLLYMTSSSTATINASGSSVSMANVGNDITIDTDTLTLNNVVATVSLTPAGELSIDYPVTGGDVSLTGFINEDGSMAILRSVYTPTAGDPQELGVVIMVERPFVPLT